MGLRVILEIRDTEDVKFDDIVQLNNDLWQNTSIKNLYGNTKPDPDFVPYKDPILLDELEIASVSEGRYFEGYDACTDTWGILGKDVFRIIANHMTSGKIILVETIEGNDLVVYVLTPNTVQHVSMDDLLKDL